MNPQDSDLNCHRDPREAPQIDSLNNPNVNPTEMDQRDRTQHHRNLDKTVEENPEDFAQNDASGPENST